MDHEICAALFIPDESVASVKIEIFYYAFLFAFIVLWAGVSPMVFVVASMVLVVPSVVLPAVAGVAFSSGDGESLGLARSVVSGRFESDHIAFIWGIANHVLDVDLKVLASFGIGDKTVAISVVEKYDFSGESLGFVQVWRVGWPV